MLRQRGEDPWVRLEMCDGWVVGALRAGVESAMVIERRAGVVKCYDRAGNVERVVCEGEDGWVDLVFCDGEGGMVEGEEGDGNGGDGVWSASLHPVLNMIRIADPDKGESANVRVVRREGVLCFALGREGEVGIRAGEALVREADGGDGMGDGGYV